MTTIQQVSQQSDPGQLVVLFTVDATALGGSVYRFTNSASATAFITFQGQNYAVLDFQADGFEVRGDGRLPTPTLKVSNAQALLLAGVIALNDLLGATVTRLRTFSQ
ncbi:MAG: phage minor tail protein L, partial [Holosporaceae bacterium]